MPPASVQAKKDESHDSIPDWSSQSQDKMDVEASEKVATGNEDEDLERKTDSQESIDSQLIFEDVLKGNDPDAIFAQHTSHTASSRTD